MMKEKKAQELNFFEGNSSLEIGMNELIRAKA